MRAAWGWVVRRSRRMFSLACYSCVFGWWLCSHGLGVQGDLLCDDMYTAFGIKSSYRCQIHDDHGPRAPLPLDTPFTIRDEWNKNVEHGFHSLVEPTYTADTRFPMPLSLTQERMTKAKKGQQLHLATNRRRGYRSRENHHRSTGKKKEGKQKTTSLWGTLHQPPPFLYIPFPSAKIIGKAR